MIKKIFSIVIWSIILFTTVWLINEISQSNLHSMTKTVLGLWTIMGARVFIEIPMFKEEK